MKILVLSLLLVASLAANVWLAQTHSSPTVAISTGSERTNVASIPTPGSTQAAGAAVPPPASPAITSWISVPSAKDLPSLVARLRAAGYPPSVVRAIVNEQLDQLFQSRQPVKQLPFWKRNRPDNATLEAQQAVEAERRSLFESLLGPDARLSATLGAAERLQRYGSLSDEKLDAVARIERDYNELRAKVWTVRNPGSGSAMESAFQQQQSIEREKLNDLATVLSPEELEQYQMRNSLSAGILSNHLAGVNITEDEYASLYRLQKAFDDSYPMPTGPMEMKTLSSRLEGQQKMFEQVRGVLGEERFYSYLAEADPNYGQVTRFTAKYPSITPSVAYQVYQIQSDVRNQMMAASRNGPTTVNMRPVVEAANAKLDALLGPDIAAEYRKQGQGAIFRTFMPPFTPGK